MPRRIDYWGLRLGIRAAINSWPGLETLPVLFEEGGEPATERLPAVLLYLVGRQTLPERQRISAGTRTDHRVVFSAWVMHYSLASLEDAVMRRDAMLAEVELALMQDRTLGGRLPKTLFLEAGAVQSGSDPKMTKFASAIETLIICDDYTSLLEG